MALKRSLLGQETICSANGEWPGCGGFCNLEKKQACTVWSGQRLDAPCHYITPYPVVEVQAVIGLLCEEFVSVHKLLVEQLDLLAEGTASDTSNLQFFKLQQVHSCQQDVLQGGRNGKWCNCRKWSDLDTHTKNAAISWWLCTFWGKLWLMFPYSP